MKPRDWWLEFARGSSMGLGMVPGVSAGTMGVIVGVYDRLISNVVSLRKDFKRSFFALLPILLGLVLSSIACLIAVHFGYDAAPFAISALFAGLILGSLPILYIEIEAEHLRVGGSLLLAAGFFVAAGIGILSAYAKFAWNLDFSEAFVRGEWWTYLLGFVGGFVAAAACIVPGISGAMILFVLGIYQPILGIFLGEDSIIHNHDRLLSGAFQTLAVAVGIVAGVLLTAKLMKGLLDKHRVGTYRVVFGFVVGSIASMFVNQNWVVTDTNGCHWLYRDIPLWEYLLGAGLFVVVGILTFLFFARKAKLMSKNRE